MYIYPEDILGNEKGCNLVNKFFSIQLKQLVVIGIRLQLWGNYCGALPVVVSLEEAEVG